MQSDLISRMGLLEDLSASCYDLDALTGITGDERKLKDAILQFPIIDAVPVVHAEWVTQGIEVYCTHCMMPQDSGTNYCPYCGAKMDGLSNVPDKNVGKLGGVINAK